MLHTMQVAQHVRGVDYEHEVEEAYFMVEQKYSVQSSKTI